VLDLNSVIIDVIIYLSLFKGAFKKIS